MQRPALADVLAVLTGAPVAAALAVGDRGAWVMRHPFGARSSARSRAHPSPADALGVLVEAALLPEHWLDPERAPWWWWGECSVCGGNPRVSDGHGFVTRETCFACDDDGYHTPTPPTHAALVAVASLGVDALARAEAIVAETWPRARLVWRVMGATELDAVLRRNHETPTQNTRVAFWWASEVLGLWSERWPEAFRFWSASDAPPEAVAMMDEQRRLYPAMRALALTEDGKPTGLHLVALADARVVLAAEALA